MSPSRRQMARSLSGVGPCYHARSLVSRAPSALLAGFQLLLLTALPAHAPAGGITYQLLDDVGLVAGPTWSPGGEWIAYARNSGDGADLWKVWATGGEPVLLLDLPGAAARPDWSPDGEWIAFTYLGPETTGQAIWKVRPDGEGAEQVVDTPESDLAPVWSPDQRQIAFYSIGGADDDLRILDVATGQWAVRWSWSTVEDPSYSPDGAWIAFSGKKPGESGTSLYRIGASVGSPEELLVVPYSIPLLEEPHWSPDGRYFAFSTTHVYGAPGGQFDVFIWRLGGGQYAVTRVTFDSGNDRGASWSPDMTAIAYTAQTNESLWIARGFSLPDGATGTRDVTWGSLRGRFSDP